MEQEGDLLTLRDKYRIVKKSPMVDHQVPPDVFWDNYLYYRQQAAKLSS